MSQCGRPGCPGTVVDGYCDTCGLAPTSALSGGPTGSRQLTARIDVERMGSGPVSSRLLSRRSTRRGPGLGGGIVELELVEEVDPATLVITDTSVPEKDRFCSHCDNQVGRSHDGRKGLDVGFCADCGRPFDFRARLQAGDLVAGQYRVVGPLAHGGMGWIYLARDLNVDRRWCVLKGLLDPGDVDAKQVAETERRFLAELSHPAIVDIYNFVGHEDQDYIVMQYVRGDSLQRTAKEHRRRHSGPLPVTEAGVYLLHVLPALGYLHDRGRVFSDFKPDNVIHTGSAVTLIDLGGVRRIDERHGSLLVTIGYQAPEIADTGPTVASDLYTVGRSLAVLTLDWPGWHEADSDPLPVPEEHQVLVQHDCLWRFLQRACAPDPAERFADAEEMAEALRGVLHQVAAAEDGRPRPYQSGRWNPPRPTLGPFDWRMLPRPILPDHPRLADRIAGVAEGDPEGAIDLAHRLGDDLSWADRAAVALAHCELGRVEQAVEALASIVPAADQDDAVGDRVRVDAARTYLHGIVGLAAAERVGEAGPGNGHTVGAVAERAQVIQGAVSRFDAAYAAAPGEPACALAYAAALEWSGDPGRREEAAALYFQVALAERSWLPALAGLARTLVQLGRPAEAARALLKVPRMHPLRAEALTRACQIMEQASLFDPQVAEAASDRLREAPRGERTTAEAELAVALYSATLAALGRGEQVGATVGGSPAEPRSLAWAAEDALLDLADATPNRARRHQLLDRAARTRPWTFW